MSVLINHATLDKMSAVDEVDLKILRILRKDSRTSCRAIGGAAGVSGATAKKRIERMLSDRIIEKFLVFVDYGIWGYTAAYFITTGEPDEPEGHDRVVSVLNLVGRIFFHISCVGNVNIFCLLIREGETLDLQKVEHIGKMLHPAGLRVIQTGAGNARAPILQPSLTDFKIISCLVKNPLMRVEEIARNAGVSAKTVKRRIGAMTEANVIRFGTWYKPQRIRGYVPFTVFLETVKDMTFRVIRELQEALPDHFFIDPITSGNLVILSLYDSSYPGVDRIYGQVKNTKGVRRAELFVQNDVAFFQDWLVNELNKHQSSARRRPVLEK